MAVIEHKTIDNRIELQITTAAIISDNFLSEVISIFNPEYLRNSFCKIVCTWCLAYYKSYKKAPGKNIQDIYLLEKESGLPKEEALLIEDFLTKLSKDHANGEGVNSDYLRDRAFEFFLQRELEIRVERAGRFLSVGKIDEAEKEFSKYRRVAFQTSGWFSPLNKKEILEVFDDSDEGVFTFPGALGKLMGPIERDWFVAILAPFKRGKSYFMQEIAVRAMFQRLRVVFISLEMKKKNLKERFYKRLTACGSDTGEDLFLFPVFDCMRNQDGTCTNPNRTNHIRLLEQDGTKPAFDVNMDYRPCTYCRDAHITDFRLDLWYEYLEAPQFAMKPVRSIVDGTLTHYGDMIRYISYPRFCAGIDDIVRDLDILEQHEGFIPDVIIVDYADILKMEKGDKRNEIDDVWKRLASIAAQRHCIMFTASQGTRGSIYKADMNQDDLAEWIGKLAHVDIFMGLNQTPEEKESKIIRVNMLVHRHKEVDEKVSAMLLQQLDVGQFAMDSEIIRRR